MFQKVKFFSPEYGPALLYKGQNYLSGHGPGRVRASTRARARASPSTCLVRVTEVSNRVVQLCSFVPGILVMKI